MLVMRCGMGCLTHQDVIFASTLEARRTICRCIASRGLQDRALPVCTISRLYAKDSDKVNKTLRRWK